MSSTQIAVYKKGLRILAGIGTTFVFGLNIAPHVFPRKSVDMVHALPPNMVKHINPQYKSLLAQTCKLMDIQADKVELTHSRGLSTISAGCLMFPNNSVVVLPRNTLYTHPDHLVHAGILFDSKKPIDWNSNVGQALKEVLILTDNEVKFLIGHELTHIKYYHFLASTAHGVGTFYGFYKLGAVLPKVLKRQSKLGPIILITISVWLAGIPFYYLTKKPLSHFLEYSADEKAAKLGSDYCEGGISYTRKKLKLNRIMRVMSENGDESYSKVGNSIKYVDTISHPRRTDRLKKLKDIKKTLFDVNVPSMSTTV